MNNSVTLPVISGVPGFAQGNIMILKNPRHKEAPITAEL